MAWTDIPPRMSARCSRPSWATVSPVASPTTWRISTCWSSATVRPSPGCPPSCASPTRSSSPTSTRTSRISPASPGWPSTCSPDGLLGAISEQHGLGKHGLCKGRLRRRLGQKLLHRLHLIRGLTGRHEQLVGEAREVRREVPADHVTQERAQMVGHFPHQPLATAALQRRPVDGGTLELHGREDPLGQLDPVGGRGTERSHADGERSEEHTSELQSLRHLV